VKPDDLSRLKINRPADGAPRLRPRRRWARYGILAAVVALAAAWAASRYSAPAPVEAATLANTYPTLAFTVLNAAGYVVPERKAALSSKASGRLEWLGVLEGSRVKQNEVVARLESKDVRAALDQAAAQVTVAQANLQQAAAELRDADANYKRSRELLAKKYISDAQHEANLARLDKARAAVESQKAALAAARANRQAAEVAVEQTLIRAPFDAIVLTKNADVGDNITPFSSATGAKAAVVTVADMDTLVPTVDRSKATVLVKVRFVDKDARVLPDMSAKVAFLERAPTADEKRPVPAVQARAIVERDGRKQVFAIREGHARRLEVSTGRRLGELVEVRGLAAGERVVLDPPAALRDGAAVTVAKK